VFSVWQGRLLVAPLVLRYINTLTY
jgi:hypothetical protein